MNIANDPHFQDATPAGPWTNWHGNFHQPLFKLYDVWNEDPNHSTLDGYNRTTQALQKILAQAMAEQRSVRALGGTWSMSPVAATDGVLLNTRPLNYRFALGLNDLDGAYPGRGTKQPRFVQAGISIATLNTYLEANGLALPTSGASNGQTIAGALATGVHGAAMQFGSIPDYVVALHLITGTNRSVWLERASYPVIDAAIPQLLGAELKRDDDLFNAALVSFGSVGLLHGVVIEPATKYFLNMWRGPITLNENMWAAIAAGDFSTVKIFDDPKLPPGTPWHFQMIMNPYEKASPSQPLATVMYKAATNDGSHKPPDPLDSNGLGDAALEIISGLTTTVQGTAQYIEKLMEHLSADYKAKSDVMGLPSQIFNDTTTRGNATSTSMGFPTNRIRDAWELAQQVVVAVQAPALLSVRLVKAGTSTLGFIRHAPVTAVLEVDGPDSSLARDAQRQLWQQLTAKGIPFTFHWGKVNNLGADPSVVRRMYGTNVDKWVAARRALLPTADLRRTFANDLLRAMQMAD